MSLRLKFNLALLLVFAAGFAVTSVMSFDLLQTNARNEVLRKASLMMDTAIAIRGYTVDQVRPHLADKLDHEFLPQTVPAYAATETLNQLRDRYPGYTYRETTINPTNPRDKAWGWEWQLVQDFRAGKLVEETVGERGEGAEQILYMARPIKIAKEACLACHSQPEVAPASMVARYGSSNGFNWQLNEIVGAQLVTVPMTIPVANANQAFWTFVWSLLTLFVMLFLLLNLMLGRLILKPIADMSRLADRISLGEFDDAEFATRGKDEVALLGQSFNRMRKSLQKAMQLAAG